MSVIEPATPIEVKSTVAPSIAWQTIRVAILVGSGFALEHFIRSDAIVQMGLAGVTALLTYGVGVWDKFKSHRKQVAMASLLPDSKAVLK